MFKWFFKLRKNGIKSLKNAVVIRKDTRFEMYDILLVGDFVGQQDQGDGFTVRHYSQATKVWPNDSQSIFNAIVQTKGAKWDFDNLVNSNDWRVRALVAANGYHLSKLLNDDEPQVVKFVMFKLVEGWNPDRVERAISGLYSRILYLKEELPHKHNYSISCPCCHKKLNERS